LDDGCSGGKCTHLASEGGTDVRYDRKRMADILRVDKVNAVERLETYPKNPRPHIGLTERIDVLKFSMVENEEDHFEGARYLSQQRQFARPVCKNMLFIP